MLSLRCMQMFVHTWDHVPTLHPKLEKLCKFWREVKDLDQAVVKQCENYATPLGGGGRPAPVSATGYAPVAMAQQQQHAVVMARGPGYGQPVPIAAPSASYISLPSQVGNLQQQPASMVYSGQQYAALRPATTPLVAQVLYPPGRAHAAHAAPQPMGVQGGYAQSAHPMHASGQSHMAGPAGAVPANQPPASAGRKRSTAFPSLAALKVNELRACSLPALWAHHRAAAACFVTLRPEQLTCHGPGGGVDDCRWCALCFRRVAVGVLLLDGDCKASACKPCGRNRSAAPPAAPALSVK